MKIKMILYQIWYELRSPQISIDFWMIISILKVNVNNVWLANIFCCLTLSTGIFILRKSDDALVLVHSF